MKVDELLPDRMQAWGEMGGIRSIPGKSTAVGNWGALPLL